MTIKYDTIGKGYNRTRQADNYLTARTLFHLKPKKEKIYLDIGCGTGNYTNEFHRLGFEFIGIDPSQKMLEKAKLKNENIDWRIGTAEETQLPNESVDGVIASLTIHHWKNLEKAFSELKRVIKPNSRIVVFTSTPNQMEGYWLNYYFPIMMKVSIVQMPSLEKVKTAMEKAGFEFLETEEYFIQPNLQDKFLYSGKHNPETYFEEKIRNGISSFCNLSNKVEIEQGLKKLRLDIDSGKIGKIINNYANNLGDYLYIIGLSKTKHK